MASWLGNGVQPFTFYHDGSEALRPGDAALGDLKKEVKTMQNPTMKWALGLLGRHW